MTVSTRLAVMQDGRIAQLGAPHQVYEAPRTRYVAEFIGDVNILEGEVRGPDGDVRLAAGGTARLAERLPPGPVELALRPEKITIERLAETRESGPNTLDGTVEDIAYLGDMSIYYVRLDGVADGGTEGAGSLVSVARTNRLRALEEPITWEDRVRLAWDASAAVVLQGETPAPG